MHNMQELLPQLRQHVDRIVEKEQQEGPHGRYILREIQLNNVALDIGSYLAKETGDHYYLQADLFHKISPETSSEQLLSEKTLSTLNAENTTRVAARTINAGCMCSMQIVVMTGQGDVERLLYAIKTEVGLPQAHRTLEAVRPEVFSAIAEMPDYFIRQLIVDRADYAQWHVEVQKDGDTLPLDYILANDFEGNPVVEIRTSVTDDFYRREILHEFMERFEYNAYDLKDNREMHEACEVKVADRATRLYYVAQYNSYRLPLGAGTRLCLLEDGSTVAVNKIALGATHLSSNILGIYGAGLMNAQSACFGAPAVDPNLRNWPAMQGLKKAATSSLGALARTIGGKLFG